MTKKEYLEGIYSELLLFCPWRNESKLRQSFDNDCEGFFTENKETIRVNKSAIFPSATMIDTMMELLQTNENTKPTHLYETIDEKAQQDDMDDQEEMNEVNPLDTSELPAETGNDQNKRKADGCPY